jgi:hypothetical protein
MVQGDSHPGRGATPGAALADAGDLQPLVAKVLKIARDLDELEGLLALKREYVIKQLDSITLLGREEAAERLAMSLAQFDREVLKGAIPCVVIDRRLRFRLLHILAYIEARVAAGRPIRPRKPKKGGAV